MTPEQVRARVDEIAKLAEAGDREAMRSEQRDLMFAALCQIKLGLPDRRVRQLAAEVVEGVHETNMVMSRAAMAEEGESE
jgi:hypothetical protein